MIIRFVVLSARMNFIGFVMDSLDLHTFNLFTTFFFLNFFPLAQLLEVLLPLLNHLSLQKDVRPVLHERFHMPEWFQMHGIPASALTV